MCSVNGSSRLHIEGKRERLRMRVASTMNFHHLQCMPLYHPSLSLHLPSPHLNHICTSPRHTSASIQKKMENIC